MLAACGDCGLRETDRVQLWPEIARVYMLREYASLWSPEPTQRHLTPNVSQRTKQWPVALSCSGCSALSGCSAESIPLCLPAAQQINKDIFVGHQGPQVALREV